jgi:hypothetical protein
MNSIVRVGDGDGLYGEQWNLSIWKFADPKVNVFGPAHKEKSHFK